MRASGIATAQTVQALARFGSSLVFGVLWTGLGRTAAVYAVAGALVDRFGSTRVATAGAALYVVIVWAGFLHLPSLPEQRVAGRPVDVYMSLPQQVTAVRVALEVIAREVRSVELRRA